jgi:hypothetical protein
MKPLALLQLSDAVQIIVVENWNIGHILICIESLFSGFGNLLLAPKA